MENKVDLCMHKNQVAVNVTMVFVPKLLWILAIRVSLVYIL